MSLLFYAWGEPVYVIIMMTSIVVNYFFGILIHQLGHFRNRQKFMLALGVALNLIFLVYFKYVGFIVQNINALLGIHLQVNPVTMPIGISFYTFHIWWMSIERK
jgi:alginate O-acetyltransferase complex protein AlgI